MAEIKEKPKASLDVAGQFDRLEFLFHTYKKQLGIVGAVVIAVVGIAAAFKWWYVPTQDAEARSEMFYAENYFAIDSFKIAAAGGVAVKLPNGTEKIIKGFEQISEDYNLTPSGNLANYYLGICYLRTGRYEEAIQKLEDFSTSDVLLSAVALGAMGDAQIELNKPDEAIRYYLKAADQYANTFNSPIYLKKAAFAYELQSNYPEAIKLYERIQREYAKSTEARDIEKYLTRAKMLGNL